MREATPTSVYNALLGVYKDKRAWWIPADIEDKKALCRLMNDPHLCERLAEELNRVHSED